MTHSYYRCKPTYTSLGPHIMYEDIKPVNGSTGFSTINHPAIGVPHGYGNPRKIVGKTPVPQATFAVSVQGGSRRQGIDGYSLEGKSCGAPMGQTHGENRRKMLVEPRKMKISWEL